MNNILTKPGMFDKALHQFLDTGAIVNTDFHLQNLAGLYRGPEHFAMPSRPMPSVPEVYMPRSYKLDNPVTIHSTHDQTISSSSDSSSTASGSHSRSGSGTSTTTTTVEETPLPAALTEQLKVFEERTEGRGVNMAQLNDDFELI
jgi:hypothetical protein